MRRYAVKRYSAEELASLARHEAKRQEILAKTLECVACGKEIAWSEDGLSTFYMREGKRYMVASICGQSEDHKHRSQ